MSHVGIMEGGEGGRWGGRWEEQGREGGGGEEEGRRWGGDGEETYSHESCNVCMRRVSLCYSIATASRAANSTQGDAAAFACGGWSWAVDMGAGSW